MQLWIPEQEIQNGKFTIQKYLGRGGYGITYSAIEKNTNNIIAIKTLNPICESKGNFEQQQVKFVQEAFRLVQCSHPHIVKVHEVINENGLWGMVMEYIQGQDLAVYVNQKGKLSEVEALKYINQVGTALEYVHQQGILHRDVKPNNIMLRENQQEAVLIDFGLAREFNLNQTGSMTNVKTHGYAPIEQYERQGKFGAYTDVYALAATLYALLTTKVPVCALNIKDGDAILKAPKKHNPNISDRVNDGIIKGMAFKPQDRTQTVREWLELVMPSQVKFSTPQNQSLKKPPLKPSQVFTTPEQQPSQASQKNILGKIQTRKFKFEYAKIDKNLKITKYPGETEGFIEDLGNNVILEMVSIPGGNFIMGAPQDEEKTRDDERPQHKVNIQSFFIGKYQVTQEQYEVIMGKNPSHFKGKNRPIEKVSWYDAVRFCEQLSKLTGKQYRLPSEAEWEYACRAGTITPFHFGKTITTDLANYDGDFTYGATPKGKYRKQTTDVGSFPANYFGLYDMHGNVWERCLDDWYSYQGATTDGSAWFNDNKNLLEKTGRNLLRGGSWRNYPDDCRSASRNLNSSRDFGDSYFVGFRVVCAVGRT